MNDPLLLPRSPEYYEDELANSLSHGLGILLSVVLVPILITLAVMEQSLAATVSAAVFGFSLLLMFSSSTLYHAVHQPRLKHLCRKLDHISIYFLIAGTYTPFILLYLHNTLGWILLSVQWLLVLLGIFYKVFLIGRYRRFSLIIYLSMGWLAVLAGRSFLQELPLACTIFIVIGGLLYTIGVIFYRWESLRGHHFIWHLFVLLASYAHYTAVLFAIELVAA